MIVSKCLNRSNHTILQHNNKTIFTQKSIHFSTCSRSNNTKNNYDAMMHLALHLNTEFDDWFLIVCIYVLSVYFLCACGSGVKKPLGPAHKTNSRAFTFDVPCVYCISTQLSQVLVSSQQQQQLSRSLCHLMCYVVHIAIDCTTTMSIVRSISTRARARLQHTWTNFGSNHFVRPCNRGGFFLFVG